MKKIIFITLVSTLFMSSCNLINPLDTKRHIAYNVDFKGTAMADGLTTMISYTGENGDTQFHDQKSFFLKWQEGAYFSKGDRVSLGVNTFKKKGTITLIIICKDCKNEDLTNGRLTKVIDLTRMGVGNIDLNLE